LDEIYVAQLSWFTQPYLNIPGSEDFVRKNCERLIMEYNNEVFKLDMDTSWELLKLKSMQWSQLSAGAQKQITLQLDKHAHRKTIDLELFTPKNPHMLSDMFHDENYQLCSIQEIEKNQFRDANAVRQSPTGGSMTFSISPGKYEIILTEPRYGARAILRYMLSPREGFYKDGKMNFDKLERDLQLELIPGVPGYKDR
jgi:hypothetical protein